MRELAKRAAAIGFFALAFVGWLSGVPVFLCALRAVAGAAALYVVMNLAGSAAIRILASAAVEDARETPEPGKEQT